MKAVTTGDRVRRRMRSVSDSLLYIKQSNTLIVGPWMYVVREGKGVESKLRK
jgi:hypothetical protein